jgi:hypothetical protein
VATCGDDTKAMIISGLSVLILQAAVNQSSEESNGGGNPDQVDESIKRQRELVDGLRDIRQRFEDLVSGRIVPRPKPVLPAEKSSE